MNGISHDRAGERRKHISGIRLLTFRKLLFLPKILSPRERRRWLLLAIAMVVSAGWLVSNVYARFTREVPKIGGSYTEGVVGELRAINPIYASRDVDRDTAKLIFSGLIKYSSEGNPIPDLAESYRVSEDGKEYTFIIRENASWHDGKPVVADDVLFTVFLVQNPQYRSPLRANWQGVTTEKLGDRVVRFSLRTAYAPFIENLTMGIIPRHLWDGVGPEQAPLHELNLKPVGSGPYRFKDLGQLKDGTVEWLEVERNPNYHDTGPTIDTISFFFFKSEETLLAAWRRGSIDGFGGINAGQLTEMNGHPSSITMLQIPRIFGIFFNSQSSPALSEKAVREAIARALDRDAITLHQQTGQRLAAEGPMPWLYEGTLVRPYDPGRARSLLEDAKWKDDDGDGIREKVAKKKGLTSTTTLSFTLTTSDWPELVIVAETARDMLKQIGIAVEIDKRPFSDLEAEVITPRNYEMLLFGHVYGYEPDPFAFWHSSQAKYPGLNITSYANKAADALLEEARRTIDPAARSERLRAFSDMVIDDLPAVFLFSQYYPYLLPSFIKGTTPARIALPSNRFNNVNEWYIKTKRVLK